MIESSYVVQGMTCGHCVSSVTEEVGKIDGVHEVDADLGSGRVVVTCNAPVADEVIEDAIAEAGYSLAR